MEINGIQAKRYGTSPDSLAFAIGHAFENLGIDSSSECFVSEYGEVVVDLRISDEKLLKKTEHFLKILGFDEK